MCGHALSARRLEREESPSALGSACLAGQKQGQGPVDHRQPLDASPRGKQNRVWGHPEAANLRRPRVITAHSKLQCDHGRPAHGALLQGPVRSPAGSDDSRPWFLLLVDGQVMTAFGIFIQDFLQSELNTCRRCSGLRGRANATPTRKAVYVASDLGRNEKAAVRHPELWLHEPLGIQTTSITVHEEGKTDRGALKVVSRDTLDDGRFRIIYRERFQGRQLCGRWWPTGSRNMVSEGGLRCAE